VITRISSGPAAPAEVGDRMGEGASSRV